MHEIWFYLKSENAKPSITDTTCPNALCKSPSSPQKLLRRPAGPPVFLELPLPQRGKRITDSSATAMKSDHLSDDEVLSRNTRVVDERRPTESLVEDISGTRPLAAFAFSSTSSHQNFAMSK